MSTSSSMASNEKPMAKDNIAVGRAGGDFDSGESPSDVPSMTVVSEGQAVYVTHPVEGWTTAVVMSLLGGDRIKVKLDTGQISDRSFQEVLLMSEERNLELCSNLTDICPVNEATVLHCLCKRFEADLFYTRAGSTVIALNPCKEITHLYSNKTIFEYHTFDRLEDHASHQCLQPHIYEIAEEAYTAMRRQIGCCHQSIVISGESGAGKTVSTKHLLRYLTVISSTAEIDIDVDKSIPGSEVEKCVLVSNPILEAFGNGTTPRNENSSRFGKYIQLQFDRNGIAIGGMINTYLLEKTRVVHKKFDVDDKNFHVFDQLLTIGHFNSLPSWLEEVKKAILESGISTAHPDSAKASSLVETSEALTDVGISHTTQIHIFKILLALLHLGKIDFISACHGDASDISVASVKARDLCSSLLELSPLNLHQAFLHRNIVSGGNSRRSVFSKACLVPEAKARRDCFVMLIYARLFDWLVNFINKQIQADDFHHSINLLDIYGFEDLHTNSLEQMCINYANERLQQFYVSHFLRDLQTEYEAEGIPWRHVAYRDNLNCVVAMDGNAGVFGILNEEVHLSRKSDDCVLKERIIDSTRQTDIVHHVRQQVRTVRQNLFAISHYAGDVTYDVAHAVSKNQDNIPQEFLQLLNQSTNPLLRDLFDNEATSFDESFYSIKNKKRKTVLTKFKQSLDGLIDHLKNTTCHYVRCIKPSGLACPGLVDPNFVLQQLRACGILQTVEICRNGYPARMTYADFVKRFSVLKSQNLVTKKSSVPALTAEPEKEEISISSGSFCGKIISQMDQQNHPNVTIRKTRKRYGQTLHDDYPSQCVDILFQIFPAGKLSQLDQQFGRSKLFLSQDQHECLEQLRSSIVHKLIVSLQTSWRSYVQKNSYRKLRRGMTLLQAHWKGYVARRNLQKMQLAAACIQRSWKTHRMKLSVRKLACDVRALRRGISLWTQRRWHRQQNFNSSCDDQDASQNNTERFNNGDVSHRHSAQTENLHSQKFIPVTAVDEFFSQESLSNAKEKPACGNNPQGEMHYEDASGESAVRPDKLSLLNEVGNKACSSSATCDASGLSPSKKPRLAPRDDLHFGNGIVTCRRLIKPGYRFHTRKSVLQYGHVTHRRYLTKGLSDALDPVDATTIGPMDKENTDA